MVQQHLTLWNVPKQHSFALELMAKCWTFCQQQPK
jgi:hypothetical protein